MVSHHLGQRFQLGFLRDLLWALCFSWCIYINDLSCGLSSTSKLLADDTSLFSVVHDVSKSTNELNDLEKISNWAYQRKMSFNPDKSKQAQKVIFSRKIQRVIHPPAIFNNMPVVVFPVRNRYTSWWKVEFF